MWNSANEPSTFLTLCNAVRCSLIQASYTEVPLVDGTIERVKTGGERCQLEFTATFSVDNTIFSLMALGDTDVDIRVGWQDSDGGNTKLGSLTATDGRILTSDINIPQDGYGSVHIVYISDNWTINNSTWS